MIHSVDEIILKNNRQIDGIRKSCQLAAQVLKYLEPYVEPGTNTETLNSLAAAYIRDHKAYPAPLKYFGYPKESCISVNEVICHGIPGPYVLKEGDIVNVDITTILDGYYGDTSKTYAVGNISAKAQHLLDVTKTCLKIGIKQVYPGNHTGNIGYEIAKYANMNSCSVVHHFSGHGVGIYFHEKPEIAHIAPQDSGPIMKPNMIFTIEPMINLGSSEAVIDTQDGWTARTIDGMLSAQYEHTILVTNNGYEVLTIGD